jgi:Na+/proline symporter
MSSVDSGIHSCSAVFFADVQRHARGGSRLVMLSRVMIAVLGVVVTVLAMYIGRIGSVFEIANKIVNGLGSPLLALFLMGMFSRRATAWGMLIGGVSGVALSSAVSLTVQDLALHYYAVANLMITMALCYIFSMVDHWRGTRSTPDQLQWMWPAIGRQSPPG